MADVSMPAPIVSWMQERDWGTHHLEWHLTRMWDWFHAWAAAGSANAADVVEFLNQMGWSRHDVQEGGPGNGLEFLAMHRAMIQLLTEEFQADAGLFVGWTTPPQDPDDPDDPVPSGIPRAFHAKKAEGITLIEASPGAFPDEDGYGIFIETERRWSAADHRGVTDDESSGVHNYLHGRWTVGSSSINLGNPEVNLFNTRFWKLHGWIDKVWTAYRAHHGLSDTDAAYVALINHYREHMGAVEHDHHELESRAERRTVKRPKVVNDLFRRDLIDDRK